MFLRSLLYTIFLCSSIIKAVAQPGPIASKQDTLKGSITPEREWWDVKYYDLYIKPDYNNKTIEGRNSISYEVLKGNHNRLMQIDLQEPLSIDSVVLRNKRLEYQREGNVYFIKVPVHRRKTLNTIDIYYSGKPKESLNPPWDGGISWAVDSSPCA